MTTTDTTSLGEALDKQLDEMNERARLWLEILQRDAARVSADFRLIADATTIQSAVNHRPDMYKLASVLEIQGHLDELLKQYEALQKLRALYAESNRA